MPRSAFRFLLSGLGAALLLAQQPAPEPAPKPSESASTLVARLDLEKYKATIKGLTQFGDRRQGTDRNRAALDWIEARLRTYGCANTERIRYDYQPPPGRAGTGRGGAGRGGRGNQSQVGPGGSRRRGNRQPETVNNDPLKQPDEKLRALDSEPSTPGMREEVFCTKIGATHPDEMYIVAAHMDGIGYGEAANDDGSGTALVMELARILSDPAVQTERSVRFALWNNEETGLNGAKAYVEQRKDLQGKESPVGSGRYPEPKWLGMIQHDMMLFDHGMPRKDGSIGKDQRPEADVNIEYAMTAKLADPAMLLAHKFQIANEKYATDYPANIGPHMTNTDSRSVQGFDRRNQSARGRARRADR
jgi:hypothetical protein